MNVIGEGIETEEQSNYLVNQGCRIGQGFLYNKAIPAQEIMEQYYQLKV
ncbi:sensor c-di-GMP phosphodiesterase-like protein [Salirhabdus euzebyi]|uniref:Sensor c-di-GMP phosphodiesterase-like protein n=1 Tax=Salirhabdus euzebyi TaxID=394506 RepID=A0A841Q522_9BACI|nr:hypothetical protein [Salirhabdus euzebyi]MBB6453488.1 sensor c-di-GMP phosphodiesterase-like protein [Salirhabdus euzebyi]